MRKTIANSSLKLMNPKYTSVTALILILWLGFGLRVFRLDVQSFWGDEVITFTRSGNSVSHLLTNLFRVRSQMPLYFVIMKAWIGIGNSEFILRYLSLLFGVLTIALIARVGRRIGGSRTGILAAFILALSPFSIWFSQEARMYALLALSILAANWFLLRILHGGNRRDWIGYTVALVIATYTHYIAVLIVVAHYTFFSLHYRYLKPLFRKWLIYAGLAGMIFGIWLVALFLTGGLTFSLLDWRKPARWFDPFLTMLSLSIGPSIDPTDIWPYLALLVYVVAISIGFASYFRKLGEPGKNENAWLNTLTFRLLIFWLLIPIILMFLISIDLPIPRKRSIYMDRYLIVALPSLILLGAWGLVTAYQKRNWHWFVPIGLILISITSFLTLKNLYFEPLYARVDWRGAIEKIIIEWQKDDIYLTSPDQLNRITYYGGSQLTVAEIPVSTYFSDESLAERELLSLLEDKSADYKRIWLITEYPNIDPHGFPQDRVNDLHPDKASKFAENWLNKNCPSVDQWQYTGITLSLIDLESCRLAKNPTVLNQLLINE